MFNLLILTSMLLATPSIALAPSIFQVDLIFPRSDTVYKPVYPFPVVLALHNPKAVQSYSPSLTLYVDAKLPGEVGTRYDILNVTNPKHGYSVVSPSSPNTILRIFSIGSLANSTRSEWSIKYYYGLLSTCSAFENEYAQLDPDYLNLGSNAPHIANGSFFGQGTITFRTDAVNGILPNITTAGSCPRVLATVGMQPGALSTTSVGNDTYSLCNVTTTKPPPSAESCALTIDSSLAKSVSSAMLESVNCNGTGISWPNMTGLIHACASKSAAEKGVYFKPGIAAILAGMLGLAMVL
jgi:hypothetical protein